MFCGIKMDVDFGNIHSERGKRKRRSWTSIDQVSRQQQQRFSPIFLDTILMGLFMSLEFQAGWLLWNSKNIDSWARKVLSKGKSGVSRTTSAERPKQRQHAALLL